jgi:Arc/MetJ-type ribon-helix-helix transcriptional regulator
VTGASKLLSRIAIQDRQIDYGPRVTYPDKCQEEGVSMPITLRPEHEELVAQAMQTGAYKDPDEVIGRALEILHSEQSWLDGHKEEIAEKIERAFGQFDRGEFFTPEESRADMARRKAAWLRDQGR